MDLDDDMPPELVETGQGVGEEAEVVQQKPVKVPITIVTGERQLNTPGYNHFLF